MDDVEASATVPCTAPAVQIVLMLTLSTMPQGVLTPFDRLEGFERRVQSRGQEAAAAGGAAGQSRLGGACNMLRLLGPVCIADGPKSGSKQQCTSHVSRLLPVARGRLAGLLPCIC